MRDAKNENENEINSALASRPQTHTTLTHSSKPRFDVHNNNNMLLLTSDVWLAFSGRETLARPQRVSGRSLRQQALAVMLVVGDDRGQVAVVVGGGRRETRLV